MEKYEEAKMEVIEFGEDVIITSGDTETPEVGG